MSTDPPPGVLMLTCQFMPDVFGGAEKQCERLAQELAGRGVSVAVLTSTQSLRHRGHSLHQGLSVHRIYTGVAPDLLGRWFVFSMYWFAAVLVWGWLNRRSFAIVHCHQGKFGAFVGVVLGRLLRRPVLIKIGNSEADMDLLCLQRKFLVGSPMARMVVKSKPVFVAISEVIAKNLEAFGCGDIHVIPNGTPPWVRGHRKRFDDGVSFFFHGRIEEIKRVDVLIHSFAIVTRQRRNVALHIIGDGAALARVQRGCRQSMPDVNVVFHGQVSNVAEEIAKYDVFVNASRAEGFSNSLLEALALGKVLVSTPVSGASDAIVPGCNGYLSEGFEASQLAVAMLSAVDLTRSDTQRKVEAENERLIDERFAMPIVGSHYQNLYQKMHSGGPIL